MATLEEMVEEISRLYNKEGFSFIDARELVIRGSGVNKRYWPELRTHFGSIFGQRGGKKKKRPRKKKKERMFSDWQIKEMISQSLDVITERRDELLSDP